MCKFDNFENHDNFEFFKQNVKFEIFGEKKLNLEKTKLKIVGIKGKLEEKEAKMAISIVNFTNSTTK